MKKLILPFIFLFLVGLGSCSKKDSTEYCNSNFATALSTQTSAMFAAAMTYSSSQTPANCTAYKNSINSYLNALEPWGKCPAYASGTSKAQFDSAIAAARSSLTALTCQ